MGSHRPVVLRIPPGVYHGWICVSQEEGIVVNMTDYPYNRDDPDEYRLPFDPARSLTTGPGGWGDWCASMCRRRYS